MPFLDKLKKIESYLAKIEQLNRSLEVSEEINRLQADLVKEYLRDLYELYADLENEAQPVRPDKPMEESAPPKNDPPIEVDVPSPITKAEPKVEAELTTPPKEVKSAEAAQDAAPEKVAARETSPAAVAEAEEPISLLEKFQKESTGNEVNRKPVSGKTLIDLIPLNEKFMFIMEFFENSISRYENTLADLEKMGERKEVLAYMEKNIWSPEMLESQKELVERFIRIVDLKFPGE